MEALYISFKQQLDAAGSGLNGIDTNELALKYSNILNAIPGINITSSAVQKTSLRSLVLKAETNNGTIWTELFFDIATGWGQETVVNIFKDKKLQLNNSGTFTDMMQSVKQYFDNKSVPA